MLETILGLIAVMAAPEPPEAGLPAGVKAVWDLEAAHRAATPTREAISANGLWRWQPARDPAGGVPEGGWGHFKVPGTWPGITDYLQKDCQTVFPHASWKDEKLGGVKAAWYERRITIPREWAGRRIAIRAEVLNSHAEVFVDGRKAGEMRFPTGEADIAAACRPGEDHVLSLLVTALPLKAVLLSFGDTSRAREVRGSVARRGLCGDVWLVGEPPGARIGHVRIETSVSTGEISVEAVLEALDPGARYALRARIDDAGKQVAEFPGEPFAAADLKDGRAVLTARWKPEKLWDLHTPGNQYALSLSLADAGGRVIDTALPERFGFREFRIDGRDFRLNGSRLFLSALPLDNAQVSAALSTYGAAKESLLRLKAIGIDFVYAHNYGCEPGTHLSFEEILRAADDVGMLVALSQPHFGQYDWKAPEADRTNGYAGHAEAYVHTAGNHPSVVMYSMSHNATGYGEDMDPDQIDGIAEARQQWGRNNAKLALRAEAIVRRLDPGRIVYHHSSGNLGSMHTVNFYTNFAPMQELDDWFEHWATKGVKPMFTCEYMVPCTWDWTMYRGWYKGGREFGSAVVPWDFCQAEWSAQTLGDRAYRIGEAEKANLRWEARRFRQGSLWHRWDYPHQVGSTVFEDQHEVIGRYLEKNWRAFRTWGLSANSPWEHHFFWTLRPGADRRRKDLTVDWEKLQRPGFSPDYLGERYERMDLAHELSDWIPTADAKAILRNNLPLLAYIAGPGEVFTRKDHNFLPGETVEKQIIAINNSRRTVTAECRWSMNLPRPLTGERRVTVETGEQGRVPLRFELPADLPSGQYAIAATVDFGDGGRQDDSFAVHVLPAPSRPSPAAAEKMALFDPKGETRTLLSSLEVSFREVEAGADLADFDVLIVGKGALSADGPGPDLGRVREGMRAIVFEQTAPALERRLGFRVAEYGLRQVFRRVPDGTLLRGLDEESLRDWRGDATLQPPRLKYGLSPRLAYTPAVEWCGIEVSHVWRCGNRGNVASVLIEKPVRGDFLPVLDGGFSLQYCPLLEHREGKGMILFCQMDVTGRTEGDPAAEALVRNIIERVAAWRPAPARQTVYMGDSAGRRHLARAGFDPGAFAGGRPPEGAVLVVGAGGGRALSVNAAAVGGFLGAGGRVLALGLDGEEARSFLPIEVGTKKGEHIAAYFEPPAAGSPLAGIGPADVHNRDPKELPLLAGAGGVTPVGDGVLATARDGSVAFFQLPPWTVSRAEGAVPSFTVSDEEAAEGKGSALLVLGSVMGSGAQFGQKVRGGEIGKTYTFSARVKGIDGPVTARLEIERPVNPWDRAVKGPDVKVPEGEWTELRVTFKVEKPFAEGWFAYLSSSEEGGRLRADDFRLVEDSGAGGNFLANAGFEEGTRPWSFSFHEQYNLRKTYRRTSFLLARLLSNLGAASSTPLLDRFRSPAKEGEKRWLDGLYLDEPEEWDDPYRFFRW
jgi:beta-galactosidase